MNYIFDTGVDPTAGVTYTSSSWAWLLKELLKAAGWEIQASSDGTNVSNTPGNGNDQITSLAEMNTNNAWYVIKQPAIARGWGRKGGRQFIVRRGTSATSWMLAYVPLDAAEAAQTPTVAGTTTAVPVFTTREALVGTLPDTTAAFAGTGGSGAHRLLIGAADEAPYGFYYGAWDASANLTASMFYFDPLEPDSVESEDEDPYVVCATNTNPWSWQGIGSVTAGPMAYWRKGLTGESFNAIGGAIYAVFRTPSIIRALPRDIGRSPYSKRERNLPIWYMRQGTDGSDVYRGIQIKGTSSLFRWKNGAWHTALRLSEQVSNDRLVLGDCVVPWPPAITPLVGA